MFFEIAREKAIEMEEGSGGLGNRVGPTRIVHEIERFFQRDKTVDEKFSHLVVAVIIARDPSTINSLPGPRKN
jgi:hypothetical protein